MSWMKRGPGSGSSGGGEPPSFAAPQAQPFPNQQQSMYGNYSVGSGMAPNQQQGPPQAYWPHQPQQGHYGQQFSQVYQQELPNTNQLYLQQPTSYNHNYTEQPYSNPPQTYPQQNYYQNQQPQQNFHQSGGANDGWDDNWDWGWEDSAKQAQKVQNVPQQQVACDNANLIEESFAPTNSWNWSMDDKKGEKQATSVPPTQAAVESTAVPSNTIQYDSTVEPQAHSVSSAPPPAEEVRTLSDKDLVKERLPNLALGKRFNLDNLTPQWSIESQMSQDSSDGPQTQSESTYRSENHSRNSASPPSPTDNSNRHYSQTGHEEGYTPNGGPSTPADRPAAQSTGKSEKRRESHDELSYSLRELSLANDERPPSDDTHESENCERAASPPPAPAPGVRPPPATLSRTVTPPSSVPAPHHPPPPSFPPPPNSQNRFKHAGPFGHRASAGPGPAPSPSFPPQTPSAALAAPALVGQTAQTPLGFEANLETTPDNSERLDAPPPPAPRAAALAPRPAPDNLEVAPRDDRNEYLQTAHLSSEDYGGNAEFAAPPGPRRMGVGRQEYGAADEPPPGLARMVPGRHTEGDRDRYMERLADGRPTDRVYRQAEGRRSPPERRLRRLDDYPQYAAPPADDRRVVTGLDRERPTPPPGARESDLDGSERAPAAPPPPADRPRDRTAAGENPQEFSGASSAEPPLAPPSDRSASPRAGGGSRRGSHAPARSSADDSERDRAFVASPRRDRRRPERDRDDDARRPRPARDDRRSDGARDRDRRERDAGADARRTRRSTRGRRYDTEDTDYYSDRERNGRRHREGSHASKPPRDDRERRYGTAERARDRDRDREPRRYRDIDPSRHYGSLRRRRDDDRRRVTFSSGAKVSDSSRSEGEHSSPTRVESRDAHTDEDAGEGRRRERRRRERHALDPYYDGYEASLYGESFLSPRQQYEYYSRLRVTDPAAYMQLYKRLVGAHKRDPHDGLAAPLYAAYERADDRASAHSGRSSAALKGNDTYSSFGGEGSLAGAPSLRAYLSDRELTTDASLNLQLEESTVRSERMTPHRYSTAHVKGSISSRHLVLVQGSYPVDGRPATVQLLSLPPRETETLHTPLVKGVTHKKSVIEYCRERVRRAAREGADDPMGYALLWGLLALMLTQNGVVVGSDIAELLMKNTEEYEYEPPRPRRSESGPSPAPPADAPAAAAEPADEAAALAKLRELLVCGNRQEAFEWAIASGQWGHALSLSAGGGRRARATLCARFLATLAPTDPLRTLYASLARTAPAAIAPWDARAGDWRPHAAIILANAPPDSDDDRAALVQLGDRLAALGRLHSAQFVYCACGVPVGRHPAAPLGVGAPPAAPPRLALLLADPRARSLRELAPDRAIVATEIYEYALSVSGSRALPELQPFKVVMAARLCDAGDYERALAYVEAAARAVAADRAAYSPALARVLADLADRLGGGDAAPADADDADSDGSPRHQRWIRDIRAAADSASVRRVPPGDGADCDLFGRPHLEQQQYDWERQRQAQEQYQLEQSAPLPAPPAALAAQPEYPYYTPAPAAAEPAPADEPYGEWAAEPAPYWHDNAYSYDDGGGAEGEEARPTITMPGAAPPARPAYAFSDDGPSAGEERAAAERESSEPKKEPKAKEEGGKEARKGWLGGILTKLSLRPPNQMILPDDSNPTIVWDADAKRWKNLDGDEQGDGAPPPPPPTLQDIMQLQGPPASASPPPAGAPPPPVSNIFKMQKGRHIKKSYVDVFNPGGAPTRAPPPAAEVLGPSPSLLPAPAYFVPQQTQTIHVSIPSSSIPERKVLRKPSESEFDPSYRSGI